MLQTVSPQGSVEEAAPRSRPDSVDCWMEGRKMQFSDSHSHSRALSPQSAILPLASIYKDNLISTRRSICRAVDRITIQHASMLASTNAALAR